MRYKDNLLRASKGDRAPRETPKYITLEAIRRAERELFKNVRRRAFPVEVNHPEKPVKKTSRLYKLDPILIDGLLCVRGRLRNAPVPAQSRNQIIFPREDHVTSLIIDHYHRICGQSSKEYLPLLQLKQNGCTLRRIWQLGTSCWSRVRPRIAVRGHWEGYRKSFPTREVSFGEQKSGPNQLYTRDLLTSYAC